MTTERKKNPIQCYTCGLVDGLPFRCNYCKEYFCSTHRNPLSHSCRFLHSYNKRKQDTLFNDKQNGKFDLSGLRSISNLLNIKTSKTELIHLSVATALVICVGLSLNNYRYFSWQFLAIFTSAFLVHELAHKLLAQYYGSWAEFRAEIYGLILTGISALPIMPFKFIAPGAVMVRIYDTSKFGRVALIGPLTNLTMGFSFLILSLTYDSYNPYFTVGASFNGWIAMFNLIPMGVLDGQKIFDWNKVVWGAAMAAAMGLFIIGYL
ncbi:AN1-type zinc finger domain-containing protein [Candidatus Nitrosocosmicus arcticus]|uniref:Putative peptidase M50 n=1 Tax=Candidatus Nitrosocosmicus arcticus TaxID=2035267 RepID=A0A557SZI9_9ARCH|nr:AN1-type zinc finger domain-containing protein [Candidatus Nitrosocosmicus arcticus]TVP42005.1 putative peptidase M50 [Candidatus Nitrosocosmicus arcticus]